MLSVTTPDFVEVYISIYIMYL